MALLIKFFFRGCGLLLFAAGSPVCVANAAPACPDIIELRQPDGRAFKAVLKGDEWESRMETTAGFTIARGKDGFWYYVKGYQGADPVLHATQAHQEAAEETVRHIRPKPHIRESRNKRLKKALRTVSNDAIDGRILIILVEFPDQAGSTDEAAWAAFLSARIGRYYETVSHGKAMLSPAMESSGAHDNGVAGWIEMEYDHPDTRANIDAQNAQLAKDAILAADAYIHFSAFDVNDDGYVDGHELAIIIVVAGYDASVSTQFRPGVWSHKWSCTVVGAPLVDGVIVADYHDGAGGYVQIGEYQATEESGKHQAVVGSVVHELGHLIFRLPDLYDSDFSSSGVGAWCVMGHGLWGMTDADVYSGETPVSPCAWVKYSLGWTGAHHGMGTETIAASGDASADSNNTVFLAATSDPDEFFLVENRQPFGYDEGLERWLGNGFNGGLAVWHIDEARSDNDSDGRRMVDLEEADGGQMGIDKGEVTDLWFQENGPEFSGASDPASSLSNRTTSGVKIWRFSQSGPSMTAEFIRYGDVNGDYNIDLADAIVGLKILTSADTGPVNLYADVNADGGIGVEEALYILRMNAF